MVVPPAVTDAEFGDTVTVVTTGGGGGVVVTVMSELPVLPLLAAVIVAVPALIAVTTPSALTVAELELLVVHVTVCPVITLPDWSLTVATSDWVAPTWSAADGGETATVVTTAGGGSWIVLDVSLEHTTSTGGSARYAQRRIARCVEANVFGMRRSSFVIKAQVRLMCRATNKAAATPRDYIGFAGGSAGVAKIRYSPVALRRRLSAGLLLAAYLLLTAFIQRSVTGSM